MEAGPPASRTNPILQHHTLRLSVSSLSSHGSCSRQQSEQSSPCENHPSSGLWKQTRSPDSRTPFQQLPKHPCLPQGARRRLSEQAPSQLKESDLSCQNPHG